MSKRKHDCSTCKHEYEPNIRPFTQEEFDRAFKDKKVWKRVLFSTVLDGWKRAEYTPLEEWHGTCLWSEYGLPADDPFFKPEHYDGEPCNLPIQLDSPSVKGLSFVYHALVREILKGTWFVNSYGIIECSSHDYYPTKGRWILRAIPVASFHHDGGGERAAQPDPPTVPPFDKWAGTKPEIAQPDPFVGKKVWWDGCYTTPGGKVAKHGKARVVKVVRYEQGLYGNYVISGTGCWYDYHVSEDHLSLTPHPLVKVWAIDKTGEVSKYQFRAGEDNPVDWERMRQENEDAEAIVVQCVEGSIKTPCNQILPSDGYKYYNVLGMQYNSWWHHTNPVESIRAEIKKQNAPKFKVGDIVVPSITIQDTKKGTIKKIHCIQEEKIWICDLDGNNLTWLYAHNLRLATRDDFKVERNGHTWLAVENYNATQIMILCDGHRYGQFDNVGASRDFINLPVCPPGLE